MISERKIQDWCKRKKIEKYTAYKEDPNKNSWNNNPKKEVLNKHWICDYCSTAIIIQDAKNKDKQDGGEFWIPATIMRGRGAVKVVAHNRCLRKMIAEVEEFIEEERKKNEEKNK